MNSQLSRRRFLEAAVATAAWSRGGISQSRPVTAPPVKLGSLSPRGSRRILYVSDPSSIARRYLPDPVAERDLRKWVDTLASARVDLFIQEAYTQGWTTYWRSPRFDYDARPQHRRFLPLLDRGKQPLGILLDQCRRRGMTFMAGLRVNDNHGHVSIRQGVGAGAAFLVDNPQWQIRETPPGPYYALSTPFDFTFDPVREYFFSATVELVDRFDVDGLELCFRDHFYFPPGKGPERKGLMTGLMKRIRRMLDEKGRERNRKLLLGARVFQTLEECDTMGLDVPAWIAEGLIDYVSPADTMYCEPNVPLEALFPPDTLHLMFPLSGAASLEQPPHEAPPGGAAHHLGPAESPGHEHVRRRRRRHLLLQPLRASLLGALLPSNAAGTGPDPGAAEPDPRQPPLCLRAGLGGVSGVWRRPDLHRSGQGRPNGAETGNSGG